MVYLSLKVLHIVAAILWVGALTLLCFITSSTKLNPEQLRTATRVTEAAIGITWLIGILLVVMGSWYSSTWWYLKVALVILISAIHAIVHRRWKETDSTSKVVLINKLIAPFLLLLTFVVVFLVVLKMPA